MKKTLFCLLSLFLFLSLKAQAPTGTDYTVKGVLIDSLTNEGEPYATIRIVKADQPMKAVKMAVTDMQGHFSESFKSLPGEHLLTITSIGKAPIMRQLNLSAATPIVDLGTLYSVEAIRGLGEVEIVAQKPLVKAELDRLSYSVEDDPDAQSNSVLEMLRKVPLVTVDGEDNIQVNGSSSFKVHVNGKPNTMMSDNPKEVLRSLPANTIKNIEVITNPGAKYDAEGIGGILNIITVGGGFEGYTATITGGVSNIREDGSVYAMIKKNKFTLSLNYSINHHNPPKGVSENVREGIDEKGELTQSIYANGTTSQNGIFQFGNLEASYEIDTLRLLTVSGGLFGGNFDSKQMADNWMNDYSLINNSPIYRYQSYAKGNNSWYNVQANVDYQRMSAVNKERFFTFSYRLNISPSTTDTHNYYDYNSEEMSHVWEERLQLQNFHSDGTRNTNEHTFQADYTTPFAKVNTLDVGMKYILRNNISDTKRFEAEGVDESYVYSDSRSSYYKHLNDIFAAYVGYGLKTGKWMLKTGVRYEHTLQHVKFLVGEGENFTSNFNDVVPSGSLGYKITDMSNIRIGYDMRIMRPSIWYLNPYVNDQDPNYISKGNPDLKNEKSNSFNLTYSSFTPKVSVNMTFRYRYNNNGIESFTRLVKTGEVVPALNGMVADHDFLFETYENIGKSQNLGLDGYFNWNVTPKTRAYINLNVNYLKFKSESQGLENDGWNVFTNVGVQHTLPLNIRLSLNGMYASPSISLQGKGSSFYNYSFRLNRSFLKEGRLTLSAYCSNVFNKYNHFKNKVSGEGFVQRTDYRYLQQSYGVSVSYRLGSLKASVQKTKRTISNNDVKEDEGNSTGGANQ